MNWSDGPVTVLEAPFPWFGGKRIVAPWVWAALGDVDNYVEPFAGSLAVLLHRPPHHRRPCETVNDMDQFLANFWRALQQDPENVAAHADWPVNESDLFARHLWLVNTGRERLARMEADPEFCDAKVAGWWVWGQCAWIGSGWCSGVGPWQCDEDEVRQLPRLGDAGRGVNRQLPHLGDAGQGVNRQRPHLGDAGQGVNRKRPHLGDAGRGIQIYFSQLATRLRRVRVCCGDWTRVLTDGALNFGSIVGVLLDPPYQGDVRTADLYRVDDHSISIAVREWALAHGDDPRYRIVLCGYEPEHAAHMPASWRVIAYSGRGAYGTAANGANPRRHLERLWLSPHCLIEPAQMSLLAEILEPAGVSFPGVTAPDGAPGPEQIELGMLASGHDDPRSGTSGQDPDIARPGPQTPPVDRKGTAPACQPEPGTDVAGGVAGGCQGERGRGAWMRFGSTFAGIGGFDLGLERAGMECAWQVEIDDACQRVLGRHWPGVGRHRGVRAVGADQLPGVDLLVGGFPCQDVSVAGRRAGLAGERSGLFFEFARLAAELRPRWLVVENVPGLLSSNGGRDMGAVVGALGELGYGLAWRVLDAQYFGVAQRRRRLFVVGCLGDPVGATAVLLEPESCGGHPPPRRRPPEDTAGSLGSQPSGGGWRDDTDRMMFVADTLLGGPTGDRGPGHGARSGDAKDRMLVAQSLLAHHKRIDLESETFVPVAHALRAKHNMALRDDADTLIAHSLRAEGADASEDGTGRGTPLVTVAEPLDASYAKTADSAGSHGAGPRNVVLGAVAVSAKQFDGVISFQERGRDGGRNLEWQEDAAYALTSPGGSKGVSFQDDMQPTVTGSNGDPGAIVTATSVRRLTPVECERLQGFPDGWTDGESDSARYRMLGNAVCVPVVEWIGRQLMQHLEAVA